MEEENIQEIMDGVEPVENQGRRKLSEVGWGFWVLGAGALWAIVELVLAVMYFFD